MQSVSRPPSLARHVWFPLLGFVLVAAGLEFSDADLWLADGIYALSGMRWGLRDAWITKALVHDGGRVFVALLALAVSACAVASLFTARFARWRRGLWYLLGSAVVSALAVAVLKEATHIACPWDLLRYGGQLPYVRNFAAQPQDWSGSGCFPAGHASAAYAWLGAYYVACEYAPRWKGWVLGLVLGTGALFGFSQQLRGAHFLSHDLWTLAICWSCATALYLWVFPAPSR